jgi:hypothetical protein
MSILEDLFFLKRDMEIMEQYRKIKELKETKDAIAKASGIHDEIVLEKLITLNVRPEEAASLSIAPLVLTAWSDGCVEPEEKEAILKSVLSMGWVKNDFDYTLIEKWLNHKPDTKLLDAWMHYVEGLCKKMTSDEISHFKKEIMSRVEIIAKTSGGIFGLGKISASEEKMIKKLESAFSVCVE